MSVKPILYSNWMSSCSWRARIALNLKEIPYDIKPIPYKNSIEDQHNDEFRKINPMEQVPALHIDGNTLIDSLNIMFYLEETKPQKPLMPQDFIKRAKVREICQIIVSGIQPLQNFYILMHVDKDSEEKRIEWAQLWIKRGFKAVEKLLTTTAGKYCFGDEITLADCCLVPQVFNARRYHVDLRPYSTIVRIDHELGKHPAFQASHPHKQPDCKLEEMK